ncbi:hypothetical protein F5Y16DRAFT_402947 [Xylariaceae sp. FL0255]|nr:hypothetical protein F5Y16DRAFT_402947 [Xylariaceae sp. FL0255]
MRKPDAGDLDLELSANMPHANNQKNRRHYAVAFRRSYDRSELPPAVDINGHEIRLQLPDRCHWRTPVNSKPSHVEWRYEYPYGAHTSSLDSLLQPEQEQYPPQVIDVTPQMSDEHPGAPPPSVRNNTVLRPRRTYVLRNTQSQKRKRKHHRSRKSLSHRCRDPDCPDYPDWHYHYPYCGIVPSGAEQTPYNIKKPRKEVRGIQKGGNSKKLTPPALRERLIEVEERRKALRRLERRKRRKAEEEEAARREWEQGSGYAVVGSPIQDPWNVVPIPPLVDPVPFQVQEPGHIVDVPYRPPYAECAGFAASGAGSHHSAGSDSATSVGKKSGGGGGSRGDSPAGSAGGGSKASKRSAGSAGAVVDNQA